MCYNITYGLIAIFRADIEYTTSEGGLKILEAIIGDFFKPPFYRLYFICGM